MVDKDGKPRFGINEIRDLVKIYKEYPDEVDKLDKMVDKDGKLKFGGFEITSSVVETYHKFPNEFEKLANIFNTDGSRRFCVSDICNLIETYQKYPAEVEKLAKMVDNDGSPRFYTQDIYELAEAYQKYPDEVEKLAKMVKNGGKPRFNGYYITVIVSEYNKLTPNEKEILNKTFKDENAKYYWIPVLMTKKSDFGTNFKIDNTFPAKLKAILDIPGLKDVPPEEKLNLLINTEEDIENLKLYLKTHPNISIPQKRNMVNLMSGIRLLNQKIDVKEFLESGMHDCILDIAHSLWHYPISILAFVNAEADTAVIKNNLEYIKSEIAKGNKMTSADIKNILSFNVDYPARKNLLEKMKLPKYISEVLLHTETIPDIQALNSILNKLKSYAGTIKNPIGIAKFLNRNKDLDLNDFYNYFSSINRKDLIKLAPRVANYNHSELLMFLEYHYDNDRDHTNFAEEDLRLTNDFTTFLSENYVNANTMAKILAAFPLTDRNIGYLPEGWTEKSGNDKNIKSKIEDIIDSFRVSGNMKSLEDKLSKVLNKSVNVERLGEGVYGTGYKISVENCEDVVLKIFHKGNTQATQVHGRNIEPQAGIFINNNSDMFVHMYFGRVCGYNDMDGYLVTQYMGEGISDVKEGHKNPEYIIESQDAWGHHNIINGKIIDYGATSVKRTDGSDPNFRLIDKNM